MLLNDESGKPTRYYYLLQDFEKDFVASKVAQNRARQFVKEIIGIEAPKTKNSAIKVSHTKASAIKSETIGSHNLKKACEKIKSGLPFGTISAFKPDEEISFLVFANEPTIIFNLRDYLLVLAQIFNQQAICYCESKYPIELINASPGKDFNKTQDSFSDIKFSTPNQLEQSLNALKNKLAAFFSKHPDKNNGIEFNEIVKTQIEALYMPQSSDGFDDFRKHLEDSIKSFIRAKKNRYGFPRIFDVADIEQEEREVIEWREKKKASKQSYKQNLQINKIANDVKRDKIVDKRTILSVIDADIERGFIPPKDLLKQLETISASLSKDIVIAIKQVEKLELNYALIDNIQHNTLDDTLDFTFIVGDSLSVQSLYVTFDLVIDIDRPMSEQFLNHIGELGSFESREQALECVRLTQAKLIIETPREALKNAELSQIEEILTGCIFNGAYRLQNDLKKGQ